MLPSLNQNYIYIQLGALRTNQKSCYRDHYDWPNKIIVTVHRTYNTGIFEIIIIILRPIIIEACNHYFHSIYILIVLKREVHQLILANTASFFMRIFHTKLFFYTKLSLNFCVYIVFFRLFSYTFVLQGHLC